ncbi:hypothetical protein O7623_24335 [Solwaraspora sp. WMMD791]|uniref:hypothetical protein n=1 Tax=unclassified Solwaraspora TaxID=2627926 RepID=UPI00249CA489|nr:MULTISPECIES: hypothetical protein [unclassified Solwaraspora]WFE26425.1 hypothetical protein O7623_24335 [Solwaraspora sp. WMMD791]WJK40988.1 hypothetical protein O7608_00540 [Solwaraspora sp. WMMA2056]
MHLAVPAEYVGHIARLIEELDQRPRPIPKPARRPRVTTRAVREWPVEELRRFAQGRSRTHQTVFAILDLLASRPGETLAVGDLAAALDSPVDKVIGALGGLTRIVKAYHDYPKWGLPLQRVPRSEPGRSGAVAYRVTAEQARRWRQVRSRQSAE